MSEKIEALLQTLRDDRQAAWESYLKTHDKYMGVCLGYYEAQKDRMTLKEIADVIGVTSSTLLKWRKQGKFERKSTVGNIGGRANKKAPDSGHDKS